MASESNGKAKIVVQLFASVFIPLVLAYIGNQYNTAMKESELQVQYIGMATDILADEPSADSQPLREWAVKVINRYSDVPLSTATADQLKKTIRLPRPVLSDDALRQAITKAQKSHDTEALRVFRRYVPTHVGQP